MSEDHQPDDKAPAAAWEEMDDDAWQPGDIIWQSRMPGGECLLLRVYDTIEEYTKEPRRRNSGREKLVWHEHDFPVLRVLHPSEGLVEDPSYYYDTLERAYEIAERVQKSSK